MRLMGAVGHSSRPHRLALPAGELPHVRRKSEEIEVLVNGTHAAILDDLVRKAPMTVAAVLVNDTWNDLAEPPNPVAPNDPSAQMTTIVTLLERAREHDVAVVVLPNCARLPKWSTGWLPNGPRAWMPRSCSPEVFT